MAQEALDEAEVGAFLDQKRGRSVAEHVRRHPAAQLGLLGNPAQAQAHGLGGERPASGVDQEGGLGRPGASTGLDGAFEQPGRLAVHEDAPRDGPARGEADDDAVLRRIEGFGDDRRLEFFDEGDGENVRVVYSFDTTDVIPLEELGDEPPAGEELDPTEKKILSDYLRASAG